MARRTSAGNATQRNGEAPPSTLAAQIVQNQTRPPAAAQQHGQAATFSELLHEILHNPFATPETDINVNVTLINVVAEAGLAPLAEGNPFAQWDVLIPQAVDSLKVIEATVKRQPEVLFAPIGPDGSPLLLPLLARLVAVCGRQKCEKLAFASFFSAVLRALDSSIDFWRYACTLQQVLLDVVDGM